MKKVPEQTAESGDKNGKHVSPFQENYIACPVCTDIEPHYAFKTRLFVERERDIDLRPTALQWSAKGFEKFHPPLYYIFHCKKCHFAAGVSHYKDPLGEAGISVKKFRSSVISAHNNIPSVRKVVKLLGNVVEDLREIDFFDSIRLHLLAIFNFSQVPEAVNTDSLNLGRYCNRLAWLYRDLSERPAEEKLVQPRLNRLFEQLRPLWPEAPGDESSAQELAVSYFNRALTNSSAIKSSKIEIEIVLLISRIYLKLGDLDNSRKYLSTARDKLRRMDDLDRLVQLGEIQETDAERVQRHADSRILGRALDELSNVYSDIRGSTEQARVEQALKFAKDLDIKNSAELQRSLAESGFDDKTIAKVIQALGKRESKGLFGLFS